MLYANTIVTKIYRKNLRQLLLSSPSLSCLFLLPPLVLAVSCIAKALLQGIVAVLTCASDTCMTELEMSESEITHNADLLSATQLTI